VVKQMHQDSIGNEASFDCMPDNLDHLYGTAEVVMNRQSEPLLGSSMCRRAADCKVRLPGRLYSCPHVANLCDDQNWSPELPEYVGIFHAYTRGFNQDTRQHKLFIITSGGCNMLSDHYFNMCMDVNEVSLAYAPLRGYLV
jgi:hypothetical protein